MKKENLKRGLKKAIFLGCLLTALFLLTAGAVSAAEMDATQNDVCISCHATPVNAPIKGKQTQTWMDGLAWPDTNFNDIHNIKISRYHAFVCFNCHNKDYASWFNNGCGGCHAGYMHYEENVPNRTNYSSTNFSDNYAESRNDTAKYAITAPRTNTDCVYCHQQSKLTYPTPVIANHDIYKAHKINLPDSSCLECHSDELTKEHAAAGRKDGSGKAISCITCHSGATKAKIRNYQPYRLRVSELKPGTVNQVVYHEEYSIPGKELLGARISILTDLKSVFTVQAFCEGQWIDVYSKEVTRKWVDINGEWNRRAISLVYAVSEDVTFPKAASKIRIISKTIASEEFYASTISNNLFEVKLDNWVFANPDPAITCSTCHTTADHLSKHDTGFDTRCTSCHSANLQSEHLTKIVASDKSEICSKCHEGNTTKLKASDVKTTINWGQKECQNCHSSGHNIELSPAIPPDIPIIDVLAWSSPMPAAIFDGEAWMPADAVTNGGKILMSKRFQDDKFLTPDSVWIFYRDRMKDLGWTLTSGGQPRPGSTSYKATFTKGSKNALLWFYDTENHLNGLVTTGYRVEMIYWAAPVEPPTEPPTGALLPNIGIASNGSVTMANVPLKALPDVVGDLTIEFWAKTNVKDGLAYRTTPLNDYNNLGLYLPWNNGSIYADFGNSWANRMSANYDDHWLNLWAHWTYVKKGNEAKLYKDKLLVARGTISSTYTRLNHSLDLGLWFNGAFDDLRIWNVARSEQEIFDNMGHELTGTEPGLVGYWKFNENTGTVLKDSTPNRNDGFIKGAVWENAQPMQYVKYVPVADPNLPIRGCLDQPSGNVAGTVNGYGWFVDPNGVAKIEILVDGVVKTTATYGSYRPDIYNAYHEYLNQNAGFDFSLDTTTLPNGNHTVAAREISNTGKQTVTNTRTIIVSNTIGYLDYPTDNATVTGTAKVSGWFLDRSGVAKIEVLVDGVATGEATYGLSRQDVYLAYPSYNNYNSGFSYSLDTTKLTNGTHTITIRETGNSQLQNYTVNSKTISVAN